MIRYRYTSKAGEELSAFERHLSFEETLDLWNKFIKYNVGASQSVDVVCEAHLLTEHKVIKIKIVILGQQPQDDLTSNT